MKDKPRRFAIHLRSRFVIYALVSASVSISTISFSQQVPRSDVPHENSASNYMRVLLRPTHPPIFDSKHRPITAGGFTEDSPFVFEDVTNKSGLNKFHHRSGTTDKSTIIEVPGSGVALLDYDNDGWLDIYLLNGSTIPALKGQEPAPKAMLLHNNHDGTFTDVTAKAGVANERWGFGVAVGDYDNDGWPDIYVANY